MEFEEKFIAFVDVLGFKNMVDASESGNGIPLREIMENLKMLGGPEDENKYKEHGPTICPQSSFIRKDLNFKVTQISDCVIVSSEVSPAGAINLVNHCWGAVINLLMKGIMCRGYITKGSIYHDNNQVIGSGYQNAYAKESSVTAFKKEINERGTPFVELDPEVLTYINNSTDSCIKKMFSRMVKAEDDITALFPFQRIANTVSFNSNVSVNKAKESNNNVRLLLCSLKERVMSYVDPSNEKAMNKAKHYIHAIEKQIEVCDKQDIMIEQTFSTC